MIFLFINNHFYNLFLFTEEDLENYTNDAEIITDDKPLLEFSAGRNVLNQQPEEVISDIEQYVSG